jgi:hypothetical protein
VGGCAVWMDFDQPADLDGWTLEATPDCAVAVDPAKEVLRFSNPGSTCSSYIEAPEAQALHDLRRQVPSIVLSSEGRGLDANLTVQFADLRVVQFTSFGGEVAFSECTTAGCSHAKYGSVAIDDDSRRWRFVLAADQTRVNFQLAGNDGVWVDRAAADLGGDPSDEGRFLVRVGLSSYPGTASGMADAVEIDELRICPP